MEDRILGLFWCDFFRQLFRQLFPSLFPHFQNQVSGLCSTHLTCDVPNVLSLLIPLIITIT